ncbi:MAG: GNAT family N-acetyltransferase [Alphaproteobacteria bacterium]|nr:GNAT family N-acetyltransferase [Alphaproteobacteria bacterium]
MQKSHPKKISLITYRDLETTDLIIEITDNQDFINQYFVLREQCYKQDLGLKNFSGGCDAFDNKGTIAIARLGHIVIGGSRLVVSLINNPCILPLEEDGFMVKDLFPELELNRHGYFEIGRTVVAPNYRHTDINFNINKLLVMNALERGCYFQFTISTLPVFRINRIIGTRLGMEHMLIKHVSVPIKHIYEALNKQGIYISISFIRPKDTRIQQRKLLEHTNTQDKLFLDKETVAS